MMRIFLQRIYKNIRFRTIIRGSSGSTKSSPTKPHPSDSAPLAEVILPVDGALGLVAEALEATITPKTLQGLFHFWDCFKIKELLLR